MPYFLRVFLFLLFSLPLVSYAEVAKPPCGESFTFEGKTDFIRCGYMGLGLGLSQLEPEVKKSAWKLDKKNDLAISLYGGYQITHDWFTEAVIADLGKAKLKYKNPLNPQKEHISTRVAAVYAGYQLPWHFIPNSHMYVKGGLSYIMHKSSDSSIVKLDRKSNFVAPALAAGIQWRFAKDWTLRGEFNSFSDKTHSLDLSVAFWMGGKKYRPTPVVEEPVEEVYELPEQTVVEQLTERNKKALAEDQLPEIYVAFNSTELDQNAQDELDALVAALKEFPEVHVVIQGHTDNVGSKVYNQKLSERRAQRVYDYLVEHEIEAERLEAKGFGMDIPVADNDTDEGRAQNRRIDFVISKNVSDEESEDTVEEP